MTAEQGEGRNGEALPPRVPPPPARPAAAAKGGVLRWVIIVPAVLLGLFVLLAGIGQFLTLYTISCEAKALSAKRALQRRVQDYKEKNGAYPADLSGLEPPSMLVLTANPGKRVHLHRLSGAELRPGAGLGNYLVRISTPAGGSCYTAVKGEFGDNPRMMMMEPCRDGSWLCLDLALPAGSYSYRIDACGLEGPPETVEAGGGVAAPAAAAAGEGGFAGDSGRWLYDPQTGIVAPGCSGLDGKIRK